MIPGFEAGVKSMRVGGRRRVIVPPDLGPPARARREAATRISMR
jgi:FKBP-type peptidyl-prolyl cis-trans isomerase